MNKHILRVEWAVIASLVLCTVVLASTPAAFAFTVDGDPSNEQYFENFTGLDGTGTDPGNFSIATIFGPTLLSGSTAGVGNFSGGSSPAGFLYNSGTEAWIAEPGDILAIAFPVSASVVEFYAAAVDGAQINVFGQVNEPATVDIALNGSGIFSFSGAITGVALTNISTDPDFDICNAYCASIDDLGFTLVPVPPAVWLFGSALGLLGWLRRMAKPNPRIAAQ